MATPIVIAFVDTTGKGLLRECHSYLLRSTECGKAVLPAVGKTQCTMETVERAASSLGVPSEKKKMRLL